MVRKIHIFEIAIFFIFFFISSVYANDIDTIIDTDKLSEQSLVTVSIKDTETGKNVYSRNEKMLVHPASTLKIITSSAALDYLGENYLFYNAIYRNGNKIYLKVGADPLFTYADAKKMIFDYKVKNQNEIKNLVIDDTIIDSISYGTGWQWDDNTNVYFPQMSPYTIDHNIFKVKVGLTAKNKVVTKNLAAYSEKIINNLQFSDTDNIVIKRDLFKPDTPVILNGTISQTNILRIPVINPKYFYLKIFAFLFVENGIRTGSNFSYGKLPIFSSTEAIVTHNIKEVLTEINQNSDNLAAELLIKHAGAMKLNDTGTTQAGLDIVKHFYNSKRINTDNLILADASGISMNDYVTADFMTDALICIKKSKYFNIIKNTMTDSYTGTFKGRIPELNGQLLKVKTGTLANTSAVTGYITTKNGKELVFSITIDNLPKNSNAKEFENKLIRAIYNL